MLRTFISKTTSPERAALLIRAVDLFENAGYLNLVDSLEAVVAADPEGTAEDSRLRFETTLGDVFEAVYRAHSITISYDITKLEEITNHLRFLLYFNTPLGYTPTIESEFDLAEYGETPKEILATLYDESGHNFFDEPVTWVDDVSIALIKKIIEQIKLNAVDRDENIRILSGVDLDNLKKFAAIYPDSLTVQHIKTVRGVVCQINHLLFTYDDQLSKMIPSDLAVELVGFSLICETPEDTSKADWVKKIVEQSAGQGSRAVDVVKQLNKVIEKVGL